MKKYLPMFALFTITILFSFASYSQDAPKADEKSADISAIPAVDSVKKVYDEYIASCKAAKDKYIKVLQSLSDAEQKNGNLDGIEELKPEIDKMNASATPASNTEFKNPTAKKAQDTFSKEMIGLKAKYVADLQKAQVDEVKAGKIDNAKLIKDYIRICQDAKYTPFVEPKAVDAKKWIAPMGGVIETYGNQIILAGHGKGDCANAIAILDQPVPKNCKITGEMKRQGPFSGFVVGYNPKTKNFLDMYSDNGTSTAWFHENLTRRGIGRFNLAFPPQDTYEQFTIEINPRSVTFKFDKSKATVEIPKGIDGDRFGISIYGGSVMQIRNLCIK